MTRILADNGVPLVGAGGTFLAAPSELLYPPSAIEVDVDGGNASVIIGALPFPGRMDYSITLEAIISGTPTVRTIVIPNAVPGTVALGDADDALGPFAANAWTYMHVAVRIYDENGNASLWGPMASTLPAQPADPGIVQGTAATGDEGEIVITLTEPIPDDGDGAVAGDGDGEPLTLQYRLADDDAASTLGDGVADTNPKIITGLTPDGLYDPQVRVLNDSARAGPWTQFLAIRAGEAVTPPAPLPVFIPQATIEAVDGDALALDFSAMFTGAVTWVVDVGIDTGVSSGTGDRLYDVASLAEGSYTIVVRGLNIDGVAATGSINVEVEAAIVPVAWSTAPPATVNPVGTAQITRNLALLVTGSGPITFASAQDAADNRFTLSSAGSLVIAAVTEASATSTITVIATGPGGGNTASTTFSLGAFADPPVTPVAGVDAIMVDAVYMFGGEVWRRPRIRFPNLPSGHVPQWGSGTLVDGTLPAAKIESMEDLGGGLWAPIMTDPAKRGNPTGVNPRVNYAVWGTDSLDVARLIRCFYYNPTTALRSMPADGFVVPLVAPASPEVQYLPWSIRKRATFDALKIGNPGQQFERVGCWDQGRDPERTGTWLGGQDENNVWATFNGLDKTGPALLGSPRSEGFWTNNMSGLYCDSTDNIMLWVGSKASMTTSRANGVFASRDWGKTCYHLEATRPVVDANGNTQAFRYIANGSNLRYGQNCVARRPQNAAGTLTLAQRPIIIIEQVYDKTNSVIGNLFVWKSTDGGSTLTYVRDLATTATPLSSYLNNAISPRTGGALFSVNVAPNGDIAIATMYGVWWSSDEGVTWTRSSILGDTTNRWVPRVEWRGGSDSTVSGAYAIVYSRTASSEVGLLRTTNIRTTGFTRPSGQAGFTAAGAAITMNAYRGITVAVSPASQDRLLIAANGSPPLISTNGGVTFNEITDLDGVGDSRGALTTELAQFWWCPNDPLVVMATTRQTLARSIDGGLTFNVDNVAFFNGAHDRGWGFSANWHDTVFCQQDYYVRWGDGGTNYAFNSAFGRSEVHNGLTMTQHWDTMAGTTSEGFTSGYGVSYLRRSPVRFITSFTESTAGGRCMLIILENPTASGSNEGNLNSWLPKPELGATRAAHAIQHPTNSDMLFIGRFRVTNLAAATMAGVTFADMVRQIRDMFVLSGTTISYWIEDNHKGSQIWRSTAADGSGQTLWYTTPSQYAANRICADPFQAERVLYSRESEDGVIRVIQRVGASLTDTVLVDLRANSIIPYLNTTLGYKVAFTAGSVAPQVGEVITRSTVTGTILSIWPTTGSWGAGTQAGYMMVRSISGTFAAGTATTPSGGAFTISGAQTSSYTLPDSPVKSIVADPNRPGLFYATMNRHGAPTVFMTIDSGATWEDITDDCPRTETECIVHPKTGDLITMGSKGRRVRAPFTGERINVSASSGLVVDAILAQGAASARIRRLVLTSGAGYIVVTGRSGTFTTGAATASGGGTATLSSAPVGYPAIPDLAAASNELRAFYATEGVPQPPNF